MKSQALKSSSQNSVSNFLNLRPKWNRQWEQTEEGLIVILVPKFGDHFFGRWIRQRLQNPNYRLKLDEIGSFVWMQCNGMHRVGEIVKAMQKEFGEKIEPAEGRLQLFLQQLQRSQSIVWV